jgi:hypothetical protein
MVAAGILLAMVGAIALLSTGSAPQQPSELMMKQEGLAMQDPNNALNKLALEFLRDGAKMPEKEMMKKLEQWHDSPSTLLAGGPHGARVQMLSQNSDGGLFTSALAEDSLLCKKKDIIIEKFDQLLKKLGGEELAANITMGRVSDEFKHAMATWLDAESQYRLTIEKEKEAKEGSTFARNSYEKWSTAYKKAKESLEAILKQHTKERANLLEERELIKEIMRMIGVLHDVKATAKSIAAGGVDSVKDPETGVSDPYATKMAMRKAKLMEKVGELKQLSSKLNIPGSAQKLSQISSLAVYSETKEVAKILMQLLKDIEDRMKIIDEVDKKAQAEVDEAQEKLVHWEKELVTLSDAADKAKETRASAGLEREKYAGDKIVAKKNMDDEKSAYEIIVPPYQREIYVIAMIKKKIIDHCKKLSEGSS